MLVSVKRVAFRQQGEDDSRAWCRLTMHHPLFFTAMTLAPLASRLSRRHFPARHTASTSTSMPTFTSIPSLHCLYLSKLIFRRPLLISLRFAAGVNHARSSLPFSNSLPAILLPRLLPASHWISSPLTSDSEEGRELCQRFKVRLLLAMACSPC